MKSSEYLRIGELAERFGLAPHVLRHWEAMGLLTPAARVSGRRRYTDDHVVRVLTIIRAKAAGMSLEQIREMLGVSGRAEREALLQRHHAELEHRLREISASKALIEHLMRCTADDFTHCPDYRRIVKDAPDLQDHSGGCCVSGSAGCRC
ncbi:helix-turn-helix domain-containing protein [Sphaerisporangium fuscum]|uniref:helix-turn-helix domain-containing protein n=1 Tax=Sphaerisporangium fuscum TaxID=2835868 RepID=UPI002029AFB9|nr:MerR family transcriptional regulator [Sphaerisporangium fuscum]